MYTEGDIKETLKEIDCPESYIEKSMLKLGYSKFPKFGLNSSDTIKLINTIINLQEEERNLFLNTDYTKPSEIEFPVSKKNIEVIVNSSENIRIAIPEEYISVEGIINLDNLFKYAEQNPNSTLSKMIQFYDEALIWHNVRIENTLRLEKVS
jgi:hypothetical protein